MAIPRSFYDDNPEDRRYADDMWAWLQLQAMDAWLLFVRTANLDASSGIVDAMLDDARCDRAIVAWAFWDQAGYFADKPEELARDSRVATILRNIERGFYRSSELELDRYELVHGAQDYLSALEKCGGKASFRLPRELCGPFEGRMARIPASYDAETEAGLAELFRMLDGYLPRSEAEYRDAQERGGNFWIRTVFALPKPPKNPLVTLSQLDDAQYVEAIFGSATAYRQVRKKAAQKSSGGDLALGKMEKLVLKVLLVATPLAIAAALIAHRIKMGAW